MPAFERATVGLFLWWSASAALGNDAYEQLSESRLAVAEAAERIATGVRLWGLKVLARTDHSEQARRGGYRLPPTQSLVIDLPYGGQPVRLVVWQAEDGATIVSVVGQSVREQERSGTRLTEVVGACLSERLREPGPSA